MSRRFRPGPWLAVLVLAASGAAVWHYWPAQPSPPAPVSPGAAAPAAPPAPAVPAEPAPVPAPLPPLEPAPDLPPLSDSDALALSLLTELMGTDAGAFVVGEFLVPRLVATIDALPRADTTRQVYAGREAGGRLQVATADGRQWIDPANSARYDAQVQVFEGTDPRALVEAYVRHYPLFDQAYRDLGVLDRRFHDRLLEVIDHLLAAPELAGPIEVRPVEGRPRWAFVDPRLERASIGHKALWRLGPDHAVRVKARLRELRALLAAQRPAG